MRPTALLDLEALASNYRFLRDKAAGAEVGAVVKANAYGLGAGPVTKALERAGCRTFFTVCLEEALAVQSCAKDPTTRFVVMNGFVPEESNAPALVPTLNHLGALEVLSAAARRDGKKKPAFIHLDTGMNRLGLSPAEQKRLIENPALLEGINILGWMTHYTCSEDFDDPMTKEQRDRFNASVARLPKARHCLANSSGMFWDKAYHGDITRPGIALYGGNPTPLQPNPMKPVLELRAPILQVRDVDSGWSVGYGASHRMTRKGRVATLALGYADGYHRTLAGQGMVKIGAFLAPLIGRISMDLVTLDVTDIPETVAHVGAMATLIGPHRTLDQIAAEAGTISYEILTSLGARVARVYQGGGDA